MERVRKIYYKEKEILILDYSDLKGEDIISVFNQAKQLALAERGKYLVLTILNSKSYVTPSLMRHVEKEVLKIDEFIEKQTIVGLSRTQEWIVKGLNLWYRRQIYAFNSFDEALEFLVM